MIFSWGVREPCSVPYTPHTPVTFLTVTICGIIKIDGGVSSGNHGIFLIYRAAAPTKKHTSVGTARQGGGGERPVPRRSQPPWHFADERQRNLGAATRKAQGRAEEHWRAEPACRQAGAFFVLLSRLEKEGQEIHAIKMLN